MGHHAVIVTAKPALTAIANIVQGDDRPLARLC
jgi:hypothetical protein